jgi:hypothetical protein
MIFYAKYRQNYEAPWLINIDEKLELKQNGRY